MRSRKVLVSREWLQALATVLECQAASVQRRELVEVPDNLRGMARAMRAASEQVRVRT
jgi:hypothetical protein